MQAISFPNSDLMWGFEKKKIKFIFLTLVRPARRAFERFPVAERGGGVGAAVGIVDALHALVVSAEGGRREIVPASKRFSM